VGNIINFYTGMLPINRGRERERKKEQKMKRKRQMLG
jgi:hypothetical protein